MGGYSAGYLAPGRCTDSPNVKIKCNGGDSGKEPYIVSHNQLLAHAAAVKIYKTKYQASQKGVIGITLVSHWFVPMSRSKMDHHAARRAVDFMFGWYMGPLTTGDYPKTMRSLVGTRLPKFSKHQSNLLNASFDFLGLNYYTSYYASHAPLLRNAGPTSPLTDSLANLTSNSFQCSLSLCITYFIFMRCYNSHD